jgi:small subunit ribosomal protein S4
MARYTGPKFKLCRREGINLFGNEKYNIKKRKTLPGQHGATAARLSEYGKLLRNKQVLKRIFQMNEKQFAKLVTVISKSYAKNKGLNHDKVLVQFLMRRLDNVILQSGYATTIMQARQMVVHGHFLLNGKKHNVPSYYVNAGDVLTLKASLQSSDLYATDQNNHQTPIWLNVSKSNFAVTVIDLPHTNEADTLDLPADVLKVIEFYARA